MSTSRTSKYSEFLQQTTRKVQTPVAAPQDELDTLLDRLEQQKQDSGLSTGGPKDPLELFRTQILEELMPAAVEVADRYAPKGITVKMDAANFLQGGRGIKLDFAFGECQLRLQGTVTDEGVAFEETRYGPRMQGELTSGPMLRLRNLNAAVFRDFLCERLAMLIRAAMRRN